MIGAVKLAHFQRDAGPGLFLVFPDESMSTKVFEGALADGSEDLVQRLPLAGLDVAMGLSGKQAAKVPVRNNYVVTVTGDEILADGAFTNTFAARIRALQHALGLIWHLYGALPK